LIYYYTFVSTDKDIGTKGEIDQWAAFFADNGCMKKTSLRWFEPLELAESL
jgi:hypothetical protein